MTDLQVKVTKSVEQVTEPGRYTVCKVSDPQNTKFGQAIILRVADKSGKEWRLFIPYSTEPSEESNLGRLVKAFGTDTSNWLEKKLDVRFDADKRRIVKPVTR